MRIIKILCLIAFTGFSAFSYSFDKANLERANQFALKYIVVPTFKVKPINLKKVINKIKFELMGETLIEISGCRSDVVKKYYNNKFSNCMMKNKRIINSHERLELGSTMLEIRKFMKELNDQS